jgi:uncharacterized protein (TIGR02147 family)
MSQIFRGDRELSLEQALGVSTFMGLSEAERDYFLLLVQRARAGTHELRDVLTKQLEAMKTAAQALKNRVKHEKFTNEDRATFYSHWYYSAVRLGISIPKANTISAISEHLHLDRALVSKIIDFLLKNNLIIEKNGKYQMGPQVTHVGHDSPFVTRHHTNWRLKALQSIDKIDEKDLFYTGPMALSYEAAASIRHLLVNLVEKSTKVASASDSETLRCLNIDWFELGKK